MTNERKQLDKFKDAARDLECDDDEQAFRERLGKIAKLDKKAAETKKPRQ